MRGTGHNDLYRSGLILLIVLEWPAKPDSVGSSLLQNNWFQSSAPAYNLQNLTVYFKEVKTIDIKKVKKYWVDCHELGRSEEGMCVWGSCPYGWISKFWDYGCRSIVGEFQKCCVKRAG